MMEIWLRCVEKISFSSKNIIVSICKVGCDTNGDSGSGKFSKKKNISIALELQVLNF